MFMIRTVLGTAFYTDSLTERVPMKTGPMTEAQAYVCATPLNRKAWMEAEDARRQMEKGATEPVVIYPPHVVTIQDLG